MHEELELMSRNVVGKLCHNHERVGPCPVEAPSVEGIVPEGEGDAALLVRRGEVQRIRNRFQLSALAREFVEVAIVSQERFEDARFTLRTCVVCHEGTCTKAPPLVPKNQFPYPRVLELLNYVNFLNLSFLGHITRKIRLFVLFSPF